MDASNGSSRHTHAAPDPGRGADDARRPIGEIFVELGFISRSELESALEVQRATGGRIGEILVDQGKLTRLDLASALAEHWEPHPYGQDESLEGSLHDAARSAAGQTPPPPEPDAQAKPRRSLLRRSSAREDALEDELGRLSERLDALVQDSRLRADHDRAAAERFQALTLRLDRVAGRLDEIDGLEARLGSVSELAAELRGELTALGRREPAVDPTERLLELSLRIDRAARDSHDRIAAIAAELRTELAVKSAGLEARLQAQLDEAAVLQRRFADVQEAAASALAGARETTEELHGEIGSLAGRLDELFGLRHADAQVARVANERLGARLEDLIMRQADEAERRDATVDESARRAERALLEGLAAVGRELIAGSAKDGKPGKRLRRSIDSLAEAIAAADARLAAQDSGSESEA